MEKVKDKEREKTTTGKRQNQNDENERLLGSKSNDRLFFIIYLIPSRKNVLCYVKNRPTTRKKDSSGEGKSTIESKRNKYQKLDMRLSFHRINKNQE